MAVSAYPAEWQWLVKIPQMISGETDGHVKTEKPKEKMCHGIYN